MYLRLDYLLCGTCEREAVNVYVHRCRFMFDSWTKIQKSPDFLLIYNIYAQKVPFGNGMLYLCVEII